jgi:hypothetical protein
MAPDSFYLILCHCLEYKGQFCIRNCGLFLNHSIHFYTICLSYTFALGVLFYSLFFSHVLRPSDWYFWVIGLIFPSVERLGVEICNCWRAAFFLSSPKNQRSEIGFGNSRIRRAGSISWDLGGAVPARHGTLMLRAALGRAL